MDKQTAIYLLGGTVIRAATNVGVSSQAVSQWPRELSPMTSDRVIAALARMHVGETNLLTIARHAIKQHGVSPIKQMALF